MYDFYRQQQFLFRGIREEAWPFKAPHATFDTSTVEGVMERYLVLWCSGQHSGSHLEAQKEGCRLVRERGKDRRHAACQGHDSAATKVPIDKWLQQTTNCNPRYLSAQILPWTN